MIQIYNKQTQSYETWGNKRSPITSNTASSGGVDGLKNGYVLCSKNYPIPPMRTSVSPYFGTRNSIGRTTKVYELQDFADSIILYKEDNTPENDPIIESTIQNNKLASSVKEESKVKELNISSSGYEIKLWLENQYDSGSMTINDFNVVTLNEDNDGNDINFQTVEPPAEPISVESKIAFNDLGNVSNARTYIELAVKDPKNTSQTTGDFNNINLTRIKIQYANVDDVTTIEDSSWNNVSKIYWDNTTSYTSNSNLFQSKLLSSNFSNGIHVIDRVNDHGSINDADTTTIRYYYIKIDNEFLSTITNYNVNSKFKFRVSYKNASNNNFGIFQQSNVITINKPNKPTISQIKMNRSNQIEISIAEMTANNKISNTIVNNNNGVFLRTIDLIAKYESDNGDIVDYISQITTANVNDKYYYHSATQDSTTVYTFDLPSGEDVSGASSLKWAFQVRVKNNLINEWSVISDTAISNNNIDHSSNNAIEITEVSTNNSLTNIKFKSMSDRNGGKIQLDWNHPAAGERGVITGKLKNNNDQNPKIKDYDVSIFRPDVNASQIVKTFTDTQGNRISNASNSKLYDDIFSIIDQNGSSANASSSGLGNTDNAEKEIKVLVKQRNEYVTNQTDVSGSIFYKLGAPNVPTANTNTSAIESTGNNTITLKWTKNTTTGFQTRELVNSGLVALSNKTVGIINYRVDISANAPESKSPFYRLAGGKFTLAPTAPQTITNINIANSSEANTYLKGSDGTIDKLDSWNNSSGTVGDVLVFPETSYTFNIWSKNIFNIESESSKTITLTTSSPSSTKSQLISSTIPINTTYDDIKDLTNYTYANEGFLLSDDAIDTKPSGITLYQITKVTGGANTTTDFPPIISASKVHRLNKNKFNDFLVDNSNNPTEYIDSIVGLHNKKLRQFRIFNNATEIYTFGSDSSFNIINDATSGRALDNMLTITSTNVKDEYDDSSRDPNNKGYWWKETMNYTIAINKNKSSLYKNPIKLIFEARYNKKLNSSSNWTNSSLDNDNHVDSVSQIIFQNTKKSDGLIYFDKLTRLPSATKKDNTTDMISYTTTNKINGIPNLYIISNSYSYNFSLNYKLTNFSEYYGLDNSKNFLEHTLKSNSGSKVSISQIQPRSWNSKNNCVRTTSGWTISDLTITNGSETNVSNEDIGSSTETGSDADVRLQLNLTNTFGTSNFPVTSSHSNVFRFIYDKKSVDLINELKEDIEAAHSTNNASFSTGNGKLMAVPNDFNPDELTSATTQGADFSDTVFDQFSSNYNSKQLILFNGKFSTPKYLYDSNTTFYNALHGNRASYGISTTTIFNNKGDTNYSWVIYKFIRKYTGSGEQFLNWFVLSFNENSNITSTNLESREAQIWIQTKLTTDGSTYTTHTYTASDGSNAHSDLNGVLKWVLYTPSASNNTDSTTGTLGTIPNLGVNNNQSSFDVTPTTNILGSSGIDISGTTYVNMKRNLAGVIKNEHKISSSGNIIYYIAVGLKNDKSLWVSKPESFDVFLPDKGTISR